MIKSMHVTLYGSQHFRNLFAGLKCYCCVVSQHFTYCTVCEILRKTKLSHEPQLGFTQTWQPLYPFCLAAKHKPIQKNSYIHTFIHSKFALLICMTNTPVLCSWLKFCLISSSMWSVCISPHPSDWWQGVMTDILEETPGPGCWLAWVGGGGEDVRYQAYRQLGHRGVTLADMDTLVGTIYQNMLKLFMHSVQNFYNIYFMIAAFSSKNLWVNNFPAFKETLDNNGTICCNTFPFSP